MKKFLLTASLFSLMLWSCGDDANDGHDHDADLDRGAELLDSTAESIERDIETAAENLHDEAEELDREVQEVMDDL